MFARRTVLLGLATAPLSGRFGEAKSLMTLFKDPDCGCCRAWGDHVCAAGFAVTPQLETQMARVKGHCQRKIGLCPRREPIALRA
jgi:hypothetical protein